MRAIDERFGRDKGAVSMVAEIGTNRAITSTPAATGDLHLFTISVFCSVSATHCIFGMRATAWLFPPFSYLSFWNFPLFLELASRAR